MEKILLLAAIIINLLLFFDVDKAYLNSTGTPYHRLPVKKRKPNVPK